MSANDIQFIQKLEISGTEIARLLEISRQSVSRGLRRDNDYLDTEKLRKISERAPKVFDIEARKIAKLITQFYPHYAEGMRRSALAEQVNIEINGDLYFCCNKLRYYMNVYKRMFADLAAYVRECKQQRFFFAFPDPDSLRYSRKSLLDWLGDQRAINQASVIVCPTIEVLPFAICGYEAKTPTIYFCDGDGFMRQNENNSRYVLRFVEDYVTTNPGRLKPLKLS